jgi:hypothetical protein
MENKIPVNLLIIFTALIILATLMCVDDYKNYIYECTDYKGNTVYCVSYQVTKGNAWGTMEDGTRIAITSYKRVPREEVKL